MSVNTRLDHLFQLATTYQFEKFDMLFAELEASLPFELFWEAYLLRAQIKLFIADPSALDDLRAAGAPGKNPNYACLNTIWEADAPNRFIVFSKEPDIQKHFAESLVEARKQMAQWYGVQGDMMVFQMQCYVLYLTGDVRGAIELVMEPFGAEAGTHTDTLLVLCARFRCHLALGNTDEAERCILEVIQMSRKYPECVAPYQAFRGWANVTTSWNGDSPRFCEDDAGKQQPVFDDRLDDLRLGSARITLMETFFADYAEHHYEGAYTLRQYYVDVFHAMYWLTVGDRKQAEVCAQRMYEIAQATDLIMPIVECGEQIIPLLRHVKERGLGFSDEWLVKVSAKAREYEKALEKYRAVNA